MMPRCKTHRSGEEYCLATVANGVIVKLVQCDSLKSAESVMCRAMMKFLLAADECDKPCLIDRSGKKGNLRPVK